MTSVPLTETPWYEPGKVKYKAETVIDQPGGWKTVLVAETVASEGLDLTAELTEHDTLHDLSIIDADRNTLAASVMAKPQQLGGEWPREQMIASDTWTWLENNIGWVYQDTGATLKITLAEDTFTADGPIRFSTVDPEREWDDWSE